MESTLGDLFGSHGKRNKDGGNLNNWLVLLQSFIRNEEGRGICVGHSFVADLQILCFDWFM